MDIDAKKTAMRNPDVKRAILEESNDHSGVPMGSMEFGIAHAEINYAQIFELNSQSTYEPTQDESFAYLARQAPETPESFLYDFLVKDGLSMAIMFFTNYTDYSLDAVREMQKWTVQRLQVYLTLARMFRSFLMPSILPIS